MKQQTDDFMGAPRPGRAAPAGQRERPFALRRARRVALPWMALASILLALALFQVASVFWSPGPAAPAPVSSAAPVRAAPPAAPASRSVAAPVTEAAPPAPGSRKVVHKCLHKGVTTFSDQPCAPGTATGQVVQADPDQNVSDGLLRSQVERARGPASGALPAAGLQADAGSLEKFQCDALAAQVKAIDQRIVQPMPQSQKDRLVALRKDYRDAQFRKGC